MGCRVTDDDVHRWENTAHGPEKLSAVLFHDKYENSLRVEAALSLIKMKARAGRRVGITIMIDTLATLQPETRQAIITSLVPAVIAELKKPPPVAQAGQPAPPDASFQFKDAAFALLSYDKTVLISDEALKQSVKTVLVEWAMADFEHRLDNRTQAFGMEQLLRFIGPAAVVGLPKLMVPTAKRLDQMATLVAELGDEGAKANGSKSLVAIATYVVSDEWKKVKTPELEAANAASKLQPTPAQFQAQLAQYQDEELIRVFGAMKKVGGRPATDFCLDFAGKKDQGEKRRQAALAALEGRLDRNNPEDIKRILAVASSPDSPDIVLDQAFRRISEMPRETVVEKLYDIFKTDKWKIRRAAAATVLKMSTTKNVDEFMKHLPEGGAQKGFAMPEALTYGAALGDLKEKPRDAITPWFSKGSGAQKTSALSWFYTFGTSADLSAVSAFEGDKTGVPACDTDPDCKWSCEVPKESNPKEREQKDIKSVGDFVKFCIEPAMKERQPEKKDEKK
jgi:hypothetical protein